MLFRRRLIWKLIPAYVVVVVLCTLAVAWFVGGEVSAMFRAQLEESLTHASHMLRPTAQELITSGRSEQFQPVTTELRRLTGYRITIIAADGTVLADSDEDRAVMANHADRPEVIEAMRGRVGRSERRSATLGQEMLYVALPLQPPGEPPIGVVRTAVPMLRVEAQTRNVQATVVLGGSLLALLIALTTAWIFQQQIARPLRDMQAGAQRMARGELSDPLPIPDSMEIGSLAQALNRMGHQLDQKIQMISEQATEREAVLASMAEGVLAVDIDREIISMNTAAARLFGLDAVQSLGRGVEEVVRHAELLRFLTHALRSDRPVAREIVLPARGDSGEKIVQAHASALRDADRQRLGAVVVFNDITRLRQLEAVRQQFVANVSHELKTPISAIAAAVETLTEDGRHDEPASDDARARRRFLAMIGRQAQRLNAIVDDLLMLARLEQEKTDDAVPMRQMPLLPVLRGAIETCQAKADAKRISVELRVPPGLEARINDTLIGQAVVNLLDNAIKYSPEDAEVTLEAQQHRGEIVIAVTDHGPGIDPEHLPRLFERFYRTDKARSRDMGGTGLGLAIVKHVAQTHHGSVSVDSTPGLDDNSGSTFRLHLPAA